MNTRSNMDVLMFRFHRRSKMAQPPSGGLTPESSPELSKRSWFGGFLTPMTAGSPLMGERKRSATSAEDSRTTIVIQNRQLSSLKGWCCNKACTVFLFPALACLFDNFVAMRSCVLTALIREIIIAAYEVTA